MAASHLTSAAAVDRIDLVVAFANTHDHLGRLTDRLSTVDAITDWVTANLGNDSDGTVIVTSADVVEVREIRDALITVLLAHADAAGPTDDELTSAERVLQRASDRYPLQAQISRTGARLISAQPGLAGVLGSVLAAVVELSQSGEWNRVKACRNCHHAFPDQTRNRSAAYCSAQCSSQAGMRAYRSRQRKKAGKG